MMDVLERVRGIGQDAGVDEAQIAMARQALMGEIAGRGAKGRPLSRPAVPRRPWIRAGVLAGAAAAVVGAVFVAGNLLPVGPVDPGDPGGPPIIGPGIATAAEVLEQAADRTAALDSPIRPGQYLLIEETQAFLEFAVPDAVTGELAPGGNRGDAEAAFMTERTSRLYVPADREDEWVWDLRGPWTVTESFGDRAEEAIAVWERQPGGDTPELWRLPGGRDPQGEGGAATLDNREEFDSMPLDPQGALDWLRERAALPGHEGASESGDGQGDAGVVWSVSSALTTNLAPAEVRSAMFRALALIEGVEISERAGDLTVFSYEAVFDGWRRVTTFTVDTGNALVTAVTDASIPSAGSIVPGTVPDERRSVTVSVVGEAP